MSRLKERFSMKEIEKVTITLQEAHFKLSKYARHSNLGITLNINDHGVRLNEPFERVKETSADQVRRGFIPDPQ
jgi:hypothetical protein